MTTHLAGVDIVLPGRVLGGGTLTISDGRIAAVEPGSAGDGDLAGHLVVPGFIDVHVHGVLGVDTLQSDDAVARIAAVLPRYGVTAFCPTSVACTPAALRSLLGQVRQARERPAPHAARVLPAHLESNFVNPEYRGAQPLACLRLPSGARPASPESTVHAFEAMDILREIEAAAPDVGIVTLAPELDGAPALIRRLVGLGILVSLGHSGASFEQARAAFDAGARHATHLFNRMPPLHHREPGLAGAALERDDVCVELIGDGVHVHPSVVRFVVAAKQAARVLAVTDGTALSGMPTGAEGRLGEQVIRVDRGAARLPDGTLAGSVLTMDALFRTLTGPIGLPVVDAAAMCATTPARALGQTGHGFIAAGAVADLAVLDPHGVVVRTYVGGRLAYRRDAPG